MSAGYGCGVVERDGGAGALYGVQQGQAEGAGIIMPLIDRKI